jgi:hypothetical protein
VAALAGALSCLCLPENSFAVDAPENRKMARQIDVMEQILDQVLLDSPNFLVPGRDNARGLYIKNYGLVFTFDASLVDKGFRHEHMSFEGFDFENKDGQIIIRGRDKDKGDRAEDDEEAPEEEEASGEEEGEDGEIRTMRDRVRSRQEKLYLRGKTEIVDVLLDYGDTLTTLGDDQSIAIVAYLRDSDYFDQRKFSQLILKAKMKDLRAYAADQLSEEEMIKRIVEAEY